MFSDAIKNMIHYYEGKLILIKCLSRVCTCSKVGTNEPDSKCKLCYGTGKEVHIKNIKGVVQESNGASTMRKNADYTITKEIFVDSKYYVDPDDLIIFEKQVYKVYQKKMHRLTDNRQVYQILYATPLKYDSQYIIQNLIDKGVKL